MKGFVSTANLSPYKVKEDTNIDIKMIWERDNTHVAENQQLSLEILSGQW